jgi:general secretion pathway protein L
LNDALLLFLDGDGAIIRWLRLANGTVTACGEGDDPLPAVGRAATVVAAVPGEQVSLSWVNLPSGLAPAQAQAAARLLAADLSAGPVVDMHIAVGREEEGGRRCVALVPNSLMAGWLAGLRAAAVEVEHVVPETLLLAPPTEGVARLDRGGISLYRSTQEAFAVEPGLAELIVGGRPLVEVGEAAFEAGLHETLSPPLLDLRQGPFARRRQWRVERARLRRLAMLALAIVAVTLLIQIANLYRHTFAADRLEAETRRVAASALPRAASLDDASGELGRRVEELRGGGAGYGATASAVFSAISATPNVELTAMSFGSDGTLRATVQGDSPATLLALRGRIEDGGLIAEAGPPRSGGGRQIADFVVRSR